MFRNFWTSRICRSGSHCYSTSLSSTQLCKRGESSGLLDGTSRTNTTKRISLLVCSSCKTIWMTSTLKRLFIFCFFYCSYFLVLITINTAYCDKFLGNIPRNLIWNDIDYILYNVVRRAIATRFDLAQESHQATYKKKKKTLQYTAKIILVFQSRMHSKTAQQNTVKVPAAQFRIAYCPS